MPTSYFKFSTLQYQGSQGGRAWMNLVCYQYSCTHPVFFRSSEIYGTALYFCYIGAIL